MFCSKCGVQVSDNSAFCHNCGAAIPKPVSSMPTQSAQNTVETQSSPVQSPYTTPASSNANPYSYPHSTQNVYTVPTYQPVYKPQPEPDSSKNGFAVCSLILSILGVIPCFINIVPAVLALIFSIIGKKSQNRGMAIAAFILSIIGIALAAIMIIALISEETYLYDYDYTGSDFGMYF